MSKPRWTWQWEALKSWSVGIGRKRGKVIIRRNRPLRMETLDQRNLLATDVFVRPLPPAPDATTLETVKPAIAGEAKPPLGEAEAPRADGSTSSAFRYDVNDDGIVSPIDVLIVVNAINELRAGHGISEEAFTAYDVKYPSIVYRAFRAADGLCA